MMQIRFTQCEIEVGVLDIVGRYARRDARPIALDAQIIRDLGVDGDDATFLMIPEIESRFGICPPVQTWSRVITVREVCALVGAHQGAAPHEVAEAKARRLAYRRRAPYFALFLIVPGLVLWWAHPQFGSFWFIGVLSFTVIASGIAWFKDHLGKQEQSRL